MDYGTCALGRIARTSRSSFPSYEEAENIGALYGALHTHLEQLDQSYEVILVDDGSKDGSWEQLHRLAVEHAHYTAIRLRRNFGQSAALAAGIDHARGAVIVLMDADLQNDPADIPKLLAGIQEGFDVVSGWREKRQDAFLLRVLPSKVANYLISRVTGVHLRDYGCTLKAYRSEVLKSNQDIRGDAPLSAGAGRLEWRAHYRDSCATSSEKVRSVQVRH